MSFIRDLEFDLMSYCLKQRGRWWANHFFRNREATELYKKLRGLDPGTVMAIVGCGCSDYEKHIRVYEEIVKPIMD